MKEYKRTLQVVAFMIFAVVLTYSLPLLQRVDFAQTALTLSAGFITGYFAAKGKGHE